MAMISVCFSPRRAIAGIALSVAALIPVSAAQADILYGSTGGANSSGGGRVYRIDTVAQTAVLVGDTGFDRAGGIEYHNSGLLYVAAGGSAGPGTLMTFNPGNGSTNVIGPIGSVQGVDALAFDSSGTLWGGAWTGSNGALVTIDPATGNVLTTVNMTGSGNAFVAGLAYRSDGTLYGSRGNAGGRQDDTVTINTITGAHTPFGTFDTVISDLAFGPSGTLYGSGTNGDIYSIDSVTGSKTFLFSTGIGNLSGLTAIPAPGALAVLGLGLAGLVRRRR